MWTAWATKAKEYKTIIVCNRWTEGEQLTINICLRSPHNPYSKVYVKVFQIKLSRLISTVLQSELATKKRYLYLIILALSNVFKFSIKFYLK